MVDKIIVRGIEFYAYGGVTEAEKAIGQRYRADVDLQLDLRPAGRSDRVEDTIHYGEVAACVIAAARERPFNLIETAVDRIVSRLFDTFPVDEVTLRLDKLLPPIDASVASAGVEIHRSR